MSRSKDRTDVSVQSNTQSSGKNKIRIVMITCICCLLTVAILIGVFAIIHAVQRSKQEKTVGTCSAYNIPYEELRYVTLYYKDVFKEEYGDDVWSDPDKAELHREELKARVLDNLSHSYAVLTICKNYAIDPDGKDVNKYINSTISDLIKENFDGSKSKYRKWLKENNMTEELLRFTVKIGYLESAIYYMMIDSGVYIPYSLDNIDEFIDYAETSKDYARTIHIYIENAKGEDPAENLRIAQQASATLRATSDPEERLDKMHEYIGSTLNDDYQLTTTNGYYFAKGEMDEIYEENTFSLNIGEVSEAFACTDGYYVVMRLQPETEYLMLNCNTLLQNYASAQLDIFIKTYRDNYPASFNEYGESLDLVAMK